MNMRKTYQKVLRRCHLANNEANSHASSPSTIVASSSHSIVDNPPPNVQHPARQLSYGTMRAKVVASRNAGIEVWSMMQTKYVQLKRIRLPDLVRITKGTRKMFGLNRSPQGKGYEMFLTDEEKRYGIHNRLAQMHFTQRCVSFLFPDGWRNSTQDANQCNRQDLAFLTIIDVGNVAAFCDRQKIRDVKSKLHL